MSQILLPVCENDLRSKFNKQKFFDKNVYPISLFYLGMVTLKNAYRMILPNLTMRSIYMDYYNQLHGIDGFANLYVPAFEQFTHDRNLEGLLQNYYEQYLGQFPAQVFDKMNENFIRCSFFELCSRNENKLTKATHFNRGNRRDKEEFHWRNHIPDYY